MPDRFSDHMLQLYATARTAATLQSGSPADASAVMAASANDEYVNPLNNSFSKEDGNNEN